jgi:predicted patatin/cPLA2 family phospholipase
VVTSALEVIKQRTLQKSLPKARSDPFKVGLCIEGGAMRSVVSIGESAALELLGMRNAFDVVYGASGGAYTGAFFVAHQALYGAQIPLDHINNNEFINLGRPFLKRRIIDLEYLLHDVMAKKVTPDWPAIVSSDVPLRVVATDAVRGKSTVVPLGKTKQSLFEALHATAHIPGAHGHKPDLVGDKLLWDAAILDPFCIDIALAEGCTHLLFLLSLPLERDRIAGLSDRYFLAPYIRKYSKRLAETYIKKYDEDIHKLVYHLHQWNPPEVSVIAPPARARIPGPLTKDRSLLAQGLMVGVDKALEELMVDVETSERIRRYIIDYLRLQPDNKQARAHQNPVPALSRA